MLVNTVLPDVAKIIRDLGFNVLVRQLGLGEELVIPPEDDTQWKTDGYGRLITTGRRLEGFSWAFRVIDGLVTEVAIRQHCVAGTLRTALGPFRPTT